MMMFLNVMRGLALCTLMLALLHPVNLGRLVMGVDAPIPCTPAGIQALLAFNGVEIEGKHVVIIGRGLTIGRPLANLLALKRPNANAAVTVVHTGVPDLGSYTRQADILIAAAGAPTGVPTAISGTVPMYYDATNNYLYVYNGAWKRVSFADNFLTQE